MLAAWPSSVWTDLETEGVGWASSSLSWEISFAFCFDIARSHCAAGAKAPWAGGGQGSLEGVLWRERGWLVSARGERWVGAECTSGAREVTCSGGMAAGRRRGHVEEGSDGRRPREEWRTERRAFARAHLERRLHPFHVGYHPRHLVALVTRGIGLLLELLLLGPDRVLVLHALLAQPIDLGLKLDTRLLQIGRASCRERV